LGGVGPKIPDPWLLKLPKTLPELMKIPFVAANCVLPEVRTRPPPDPDPPPPAAPKTFSAIAPPSPKFVAEPVLDPTPTCVAFSPIRVPVVVLAILRAPLPPPKPPVGPVETGTIVMLKVEGVIPPPVLFDFLDFLELPDVGGMGVPGVSMITVSNSTGLKPAPKLPAPEEVVVPSKVRTPSPPPVMPTLPSCEPVAPPAELPSAVPKGVRMKPLLKLVLVKSPPPVTLAAPRIPVALEVWTDPLPVALPLASEAPEINPPAKSKFCNFLDPLRLLVRVILLLLEGA
jgi:hypothetical protein